MKTFEEYIIEYNERKKEFREFQLPSLDIENPALNYLFYYYMDENGNLLAVAEKLHPWKDESLPLSEYMKFYFIPRKTMKKYFSKLNP